MKLKIGSAIAVALFAATATNAEKAEYTIDPGHTEIGFSVKHLVITNVKGQFNEFEGTIFYDPEKIENSSVDVTIQAASVDTDHEKRDADLRGEGFLEVEKFPTITFKSTEVREKGDAFVAVGNLTIHGVTKQVEIPFVLNGPIQDPWGNTKIGVEASLTINRKDYGLTYNKMLEAGGLVVGDEVKIQLDVEAAKNEQV